MLFHIAIFVCLHFNKMKIVLFFLLNKKTDVRACHFFFLSVHCCECAGRIDVNAFKFSNLYSLFEHQIWYFAIKAI